MPVIVSVKVHVTIRSWRGLRLPSHLFLSIGLSGELERRRAVAIGRRAVATGRQKNLHHLMVSNRGRRDMGRGG
jgi:hypothetical protein